jgi:putative intracellular protease/amidase
MSLKSNVVLRCILWCALAIVTPNLHAAPVVPAVVAPVLKAVAKYFGKEGAGEATEFMTQRGGKELVRKVTAKVAADGGDEAVEQLAKMVSKHGPETLRALDGAANPSAVMSAIRQLPDDQTAAAISRLAAGGPGRELADATAELGVKALTSELKHPGVGLVLVRSLADDGAELATRLSTDQAVTVARHADDIAVLPASQRQGVLAMLRNDTEAMVKFAGRFAEANPGKTLFTVATTGVILAEPDRILGGDEIVYDADGNPVLMRKSGLVDRTVETTVSAGGEMLGHLSNAYVRPLFLTALAFVTTFAAIFLILKLRGAKRDSPA